MRPPFSATYASAAGRNGSRCSRVAVLAPVSKTCVPGICCFPPASHEQHLLIQYHEQDHNARKHMRLMGWPVMSGYSEYVPPALLNAVIVLSTGTLNCYPGTTNAIVQLLGRKHSSCTKGSAVRTSITPSCLSCASLDSVFMEIMPCTMIRQHGLRPFLNTGFSR